MKRNWIGSMCLLVGSTLCVGSGALVLTQMAGCSFENESIREYDDHGNLIKETDKCKGQLQNPLDRPQNLRPSGMVPTSHPDLCILIDPNGKYYLGCVPGYPGKVFPIRDWDCTVAAASVPNIDHVNTRISAASENGPFTVTLFDNPTPLWSAPDRPPFGVSYTTIDGDETVRSSSLPHLLSALYEKGFTSFGEQGAGGPWGEVENATYFNPSGDPQQVYIPGLRYHTDSSDLEGTWVPILTFERNITPTNETPAGSHQAATARPR